MKGQTQIANVEFHYWIEDGYLHLKASDFVYQDLIGQEGIETIIDLMKSNDVTKLLLNYEHGFLAEILQLDDRPDLYKKLQVPLDFRMAVFTKLKSSDIRYYDKVLEESDYQVKWFIDLDEAKGWLIKYD